MSDRFTVLRDYCTSFQPYREVRPNSCSIEEEYELHKRIAAADAMAKALEECLKDTFTASDGMSECGDSYAKMRYRAGTAALAAYNALK